MNRPKCGRERCTRRQHARGLCARHHDEFSRRRRAAFGPNWLVDARPAARHVAALHAAGLSYRRIAELVGVHHETLSRIGAHRWITAETSAHVLAVPIPRSPFEEATPDTKIAVVGTRRRLRALCAAGYSNRDLAARLGLNEAGVARIYGVGRLRQTHVTADLARRVDALFRELQLVPGPNGRARDRARARGWVPPLAWDEETIDDPEARPAIADEVKVSFIDRYRDAKDVGKSHEQIAELFGVKPDSLERQLMRLGMWAAS